MIKTVDELKNLVKWAEEAGLKQVKVDGIEFTFSDYQLAKRVISEIDQTTPSTATAKMPTEARDISKNMTEADPEAPKSIYDDPDLFLSAN